MQCLCGFQQKPESLRKLEEHLNFCTLGGYLKNQKSYQIVWREGEFKVVSAAEKGERTYSIFPEKPVVELNHSLGFDGILPPVKPADSPIVPEPETKPAAKPKAAAKKKSATKKKV